MIQITEKNSDKMSVIRALENFECGLVNEQEHIPHKLLSEKFFVSVFLLLRLVVFKFIKFKYFIDSNVTTTTK